jgi:lysozyme
MSKVRAFAAGTSVAVMTTALIAHWEGQDLVAKHNTFDPPGITTVCDGVTNYDWPWLKPGMKFTPAQCDAALQKLVPKYRAPLEHCVHNFGKMPKYRQSAMTSASYNLGPGRICKSIAPLLNAGRTQEACDKLTEFESANHKKLPGLVNRREDYIWGERAWCLEERDP